MIEGSNPNLLDRIRRYFGRRRYLNLENQPDNIDDRNYLAITLGVIYAYVGLVTTASNIMRLAAMYPRFNNSVISYGSAAILGTASGYSNIVFVTQLSALLNKISNFLFRSDSAALRAEAPSAVIYFTLGLVSTIPSSIRGLTSTILPQANNYLMGATTLALLPVYGNDFKELWDGGLKEGIFELKTNGIYKFSKDKLSDLYKNKGKAFAEAILLTMGVLYIMSYVSVIRKFPKLDKVPSGLFIAARTPFMWSAVKKTTNAIKDPHPAHKTGRFAFDLAIIASSALSTTAIYAANVNREDPDFSSTLFYCIAIATFIFAILHRIKNVLVPAQISVIAQLNNNQQLNAVAVAPDQPIRPSFLARVRNCLPVMPAPLNLHLNNR